MGVFFTNRLLLFLAHAQCVGKATTVPTVCWSVSAATTAPVIPSPASVTARPAGPIRSVTNVSEFQCQILYI